MYFLFRQTSKRVSSFVKLRIKPTPTQISTKAPRILCDNLSGILSDIYSYYFWHTIWDLSGILSDILSEARGSCQGPESWQPWLTVRVRPPELTICIRVHVRVCRRDVLLKSREPQWASPGRWGKKLRKAGTNKKTRKGRIKNRVSERQNAMFQR